MLFEVENIAEKWAIFLRNHNRVEKWVPKMKIDQKSREEWYNRKGEEAMQVKERSWNKWRKNKRGDL